MKNIDENSYVEVPETYSRRRLNEMYRAIPLKDTASRLLRKYFNAMANLYGIITLQKAWEIISLQNPALVSRDEFYAFAEIARYEREGYFILKDEERYFNCPVTKRSDWKIIDTMLFYDENDALQDVEDCQQGKDYFVPPKTELLRYADPAYCEPTPQAERLRIFLSETLHMDEVEEDLAFEDILLHTRCFSNCFGRLTTIIGQAGIDLRSILSEFVPVCQDFNNNTRMQANRGFTPIETSAMIYPEDQPPEAGSFGPNVRELLADGTIDAKKLRQSISKAEFTDERLRPLILNALDEAESAVKAQAGRNDPCPCGSGKKYKKCCGR